MHPHTADAVVARPSLVPPLLVAGAAAGCCALALADDPADGSIVPTCPLVALTGWWCPLCGSLRGVRRLLLGDPAGALAANALLVASLPLLAWGWLAWMARATGNRTLPSPARLPRATWLAVGIVAVVFSVARNTGPGAALAP